MINIDYSYSSIKKENIVNLETRIKEIVSNLEKKENNKNI